MKNYLLKQTKKGLSITMAVLMVLTCWVFVAPEKAEAQSSGTYSWSLTWKDDNGNGMKNGGLTVSVYGKSNNGTGSESTINTTSIGGEALNTTSEKTICSGTTSAGVFPYKFYIPSFRNENTSDNCTNHWRLYVNNVVVAESSYGHGNSAGADARTVTCGNDKYPYLNDIAWSAANTNTSRNATTSNASVQVGTMTLKDQYGVVLYVNSLTSSASYNGANITSSITATSDKEEVVGTGYCYVTNNNNTSNVTTYINYKAFPTTQSATKYTVSNIGYNVVWKGYTQTITRSATWSGSLIINNPYTDVTYNAQGNANEPDNNSPYGAASGTKNATIGGTTGFTTRVYYNWDITQGGAPNDRDNTSDKYTKRDYYSFKYYTIGAASSDPAVYITHAGTAENQGYNQTGHDGNIDNTAPYGNGIVMGTEASTVFPNGSYNTNTKTYYGWWEPNHYTVTFLNADGNQLYKNEEQDADHYAYYGGAYPTYAQGNTFAYSFAGWVNLNTGELITGTNWGNQGLLNAAALNQYVYEDTTYMAYYTAVKVDDGAGHSAYKVKFDYNGDGVITTGEGDIIDETDNAYYDKVYRSTNVPTLTGEVFDTRTFYNWVDAGITATRGTVDYNDNGMTITSTANDCYSSYSPAVSVTPGTYHYSFNAADLAGNSFLNSGVEIFFFYYTTQEATGSYSDAYSKAFRTPGTCSGTFTVPASMSGMRIRLDANDAGNIVKFSDIKIWREENTYTKPSTAEVDYSNPVWINMYDGSRLLANTRMIEEIQSYKVKFDETPVNYSLTLITGSNNGNVQLQSGTNYYANANTGVKEENDTYTWADTITLPDPGNFADGVYDYQFTGWVDSNGTVRQAGYNLAKASGVTEADGIYDDEYVRADGLNESTGLDTITYRARYTRTAKTYVVNFVDESGTIIANRNWTGEYQTILPVSSPADQTKVDTLVENNPLRYTYRFVGWDNTKTTAIENYSAAYINNFYATNGVTADATYKPVFESTYHYYVKYQNYDGTAISWAPAWFTYGEAINNSNLPENNGATIATPASTQVYTYEVEGWATAVGAKLIPGTTTVTGDITYIAQLKQTLQEYDVSFYGEDGTTLIGTVADVPYGSRPKDIGTVPTATKAQTEQFVFTFVGWDDMDTQNVIENTAAADLDVVHGHQRYKAIFSQAKRGYPVSFKVPNAVTYTTTGTVNINATTYKDYSWTDSGINFGPAKLPAYYYGERVTAPSVAPTLTNPTQATGYEIIFVGWFTGPNGTGDQLGRGTRIEGESSPTTYYAYFKYVGLQYSVQFFEGTDVVTPFATLTEVNYGTNATSDAASAAAQLEPYFDETNHYTFDKWVLADGTTAAASALSNVTSALKVYAVYTQAAHSFGTWTDTTPATYYSAGVATRTCSVCGCTQTKWITRLEDDTAPTGRIVIKDGDNNNYESTTNYSETYNDSNTVYVKGNSVDVQINTTDIGLGVKKLYYAVAEDATYDPTAHSWAELAEDGFAIESDLKNAHFAINGEDGHYYIVYVFAYDNAVTWDDSDVVNGEPTATSTDPNELYLSSYKVIFDIDSPEITVTNTDNFHNADSSVFCNNADIDISDTFLDRVVITKDGETFEDNTAIVSSTFSKTITEAGAYVVTAYDITGKATSYTFTVQAGHDYDADNDGTDDSFVYTQPTCTVNGYTTHTCVICGTQYVVQDDPETTLGHSWDEGTVTTEPTCTETGIRTFICTRCGESKTEVIPATNHANASAVEAVAPTCTQQGFEAGVYCPDCDTWISGHETIAALGHDYDTNNDGTVNADDRYSHTEATCGVNAYDTYRCVRFDECGESYTVDYPDTALTHNYGEEVVYEATCEHYGLMKHECANCGDVYYTRIEMTAHDYEWQTVIYPTCCTTGLERGYCKVCGVEDPAYPDGRELAMTEHEFGAWAVVTPAACGVEGLERRECKNFAACGQFEERAIEALEHNWVLTETIVATTEHGGYELWTCSLCGETEHRNATPATATYNVTVYDEDGTTVIGSVGTIGGDTLRAADINTTPLVKTGYTFNKWVNMDGTDIAWPVTVSGNMSVKAAYTINTFTVTWKAGELADEIDTVNYNTVPTYDGAQPTKTADAKYTYTFKGWSTDASAEAGDVLAAIPAATADVTYYAIFSKTGILYTITWKDGEGEIIDEIQAAYETTPVAPATVADYSDDAADYTWNGGWTPQVRLVSGNATYTATYNATPKTATIYYFASAEDASDISKAIITQTYAVGETFVLPAGPAKESTQQYNYTFSQWLAADAQTATAPAGTIAYVNNGYKFVAAYDASSIDYTVNFTNDDDTLIETQTKLYGETVTAPAAPTKAVPAEDTGKYYYNFIGWKYRGVTYAANELPTVASDMSFTAVYEQVYNKFDVTFKSWDGTSTYKTTEMTYGDSISYSGATPYIARTAEYTYEFMGWSDAANSNTALETLGTVGMADITFYAAFTQTKRSYTVTWNVDGTAVERTLEYGAAVAYPTGEDGVPALEKAATPYRTYTFIGWSKTEGATEAEYAPDAVLPTVAGNVTYYAVYSSVINQVSATWNNYDDAMLETKTGDYGFTPAYAGETPVKPTDDGVEGADYTYTFTGWLDQNGKVYAADASFGRITENMTYTAQFEKTFKSYTVTFKNYNGNVISTKADYSYGASIVVPAENPSKPDANNNHYNFIGWSTDGVTAEDLTAATVKANVEYTAIFEEIPFETFTITFMNGESIFENVTYTTGETVAKPATDPTKASDAPGGEAEYSYNFIGWSATADGTDESVITDWSAVKATADASYYAIYKQDVKEYSVTFKNDNGNFIKLVKYGYGINAATDAPTDLTKAQTNTTTYEFSGWSTTEGGTTLVTDFTVTADATYYAVYTPTTRLYSVKFVNYNGDVVSVKNDYQYNEAIVLPEENPTRAEDNTYTYVFSTWSPKLPTTVTKTAVYTAQYTAIAKTYDVFFYDSAFADDGTLTAKIDKAYSYKAYTYDAALVQPTAPSIMDTDEFDYTFIGWAVYSDETNTVATLPETVTAGASYKAVYTRVTKQYTVAFKNYDATAIGEAQTVNYGTTGIAAPAAPEKAQDDTYTYVFEGWSNGAETLSAAEIAAKTVVANATYTAVFTPVYREYTVTFLKENGTDVIKTAGYHYNDAVIVPNAPAKEVIGETWVFSGWTDGTTTYSAGYVPNVTADATYTAVYSGGKDNYTVQFIIDGVVVKSGVYKYGDALTDADIDTDKAADTQYVYTFKGWSTTAEGDITETLPATVSSGANYYAVYDKDDITYTVTWMVDGAAMTPNSSYKYKYNETIKLPENPTLAGVSGDYHYDFNGWSTEAENHAKIVTLNNVKVKTNATYYAIFTKVVEKYTVSFRYADDANKRVCADELYNYNASLAAVEHPVKADLVDDENFKKTVYTFAGWSVAADQTVEYATSAALPVVTADATYYAVFTSTVIPYTPVYTITLMSGTSVFAVVSAQRNTTPTYTGTPARAFDDAKHYVFAGWTTSASASASEAVMTLPTAIADATYYAVYDGISHNLVENSELWYECSKGGLGLHTWDCADCEFQKSESFDAVHSYELQEEGSHAATYRSNGTEYYICAACGLTDVRTTERLGMAVTFQVVNEDGAPVSGAIVTVYANGSAIDHSTTNSNGMVTLYVPKEGGEFNVVIDSDAYETVNGTIRVNSSGDVTTNFSALKSIYCDCTCHKNTFWAKIFQLLYKILHNMFGATCCDCQTYL